MAKRGDDFPVLPTQRLRLRRVEPRDADGLHACFGDPEAMRFWDLPPCATMAETERIMRWLAKTTSPHDHLGWAIADKAQDRCLGMVCYHHREARNKRLEVGYIVAPAHQGQGLGREAVQAVVDYCVGTLGVHRLQALIDPENRASIGLVERLGFHCEGGPLTDYWCVGDGYRSAMLYAFVTTRDAAAPRCKPLRARAATAVPRRPAGRASSAVPGDRTAPRLLIVPQRTSVSNRERTSLRRAADRGSMPMQALAGAAMPTLDDMTGRSFALLDQAERDRLASLLRPLPWIDGLIAAMVIAPDAPAEMDEQEEIEGAPDWLDFIWSEASEAEVDRLTLPQSVEIVTPVMDHYCHVANALFEAPETYRPYLAGCSDPLEAAALWAAGFRVGISLEPDAWGALLADEDALSLLVVVLSLLRDEDLPEEMRAESPFRDMPADRRDRMRRAAVEMLSEIVPALHEHALGLDEDADLDDDPPDDHVLATPKVGRNDPCPCGSGKKHKKCCLE